MLTPTKPTLDALVAAAQKVQAEADHAALAKASPPAAPPAPAVILPERELPTQEK